MTLKHLKVEKMVNFASFYVLKLLKNMLKMLLFFKLQYLKIPKLENFGSYLILTKDYIRIDIHMDDQQ